MNNPLEATVADAMSQDVVTITPDEYLLVLRELLSGHRIHHLLVVEDGQLVGVISDRDVLKALSPFLGTTVEQHRDVHTLGIRAREIMSATPVTIQSDASLAKATSLLLTHDISCLPVLGAGGQIEGILTSRDILRRSGD